MGAAAPARVPAPRRSPPKGRPPARRRTSPVRRAPTRRTAAAAPALAGGALIPSAAARTAGAVRDLSDSSLILRLTRGRGWIAVLCFLLGGIVALNVISLSLNAGSGQLSRQIEQLERKNSALRADLAERLSSNQVEAAAARLGLATPDPTEVGYLSASGSDFEQLAKLLRNETVLTTSAADTAAPQPTSAEQVSSAPQGAATQSEPTTTQPTQPAPAPAPSGGEGSGGVGL